MLRLEFLETCQVRVIPFDRLDIEGSPVGPQIGKYSMSAAGMVLKLLSVITRSLVMLASSNDCRCG